MPPLSEEQWQEMLGNIAPQDNAPGFGDGFIYGLTGYKRHEDAHEKVFGRVAGELAGYASMAVSWRMPMAGKLVSKLAGMQFAKPIVGAKRALDLWASPKGRKAYEKIGFSPENAKILSKQASTDIGLEMAFQGGKLGVGYGSGTEDAPVGHKMAELGLIAGVTPIGTAAGFKAGQGIKHLYRKFKAKPEDVANANEVGKVIRPEDTEMFAAPQNRTKSSKSEEIINQVREEEFVRHQTSWIKEKTNKFLHSANIDTGPETPVTPPENISASTTGPGKEWMGLSPKTIEAKKSYSRFGRKTMRLFREMFIGKSSNLRADLNAAVRAKKFSQEQADALLREYDIQMNLVSTTDWKFNQAHEAIWEPLPDDLWDKFDEYVLARATKAAMNRAKEKHDGQIPFHSMFTEEEVNHIIGGVEAAFLKQDKEAIQIKQAGDDLFDFIRKNITHEYYKHGIGIDEGNLEDMTMDYLPRQFLHILDRRGGFSTSGGSRRIVGPQAIREGAKDFQNVSARMLLRHALGQVQKSVQTQRIAKIFAEIADSSSDSSSLVSRGQLGEKGKRVSPGGEGWVEMDLFVKKQTKEGVEKTEKDKIFLNREIAKDIEEGDPLINFWAAHKLRTISLSTIMKKAAVEYDPIFGAIKNPMLDGLQQFLTDFTGQRSSFLPKYLFQIREDLAVVRKDVLAGKGKYIDAFAYHGGPIKALITHEARGGVPETVDDWIKYGISEKGKQSRTVQQLHKIASFPTTTSEMMMRLAMFRRSLKNSAARMDMSVEKLLDDSRYEEEVRKAVEHSINYVNFADGSKAIKAVDTIAPFLQAGFSVVRPHARAATKAPMTYAWKTMQLMTIAQTLYLANRTIGNKEDYDKIPSLVKANNHIIMTPFKVTEKGKTQHFYIQIPKDSTTAPIVALGEAIVKRVIDGEIPSDELIDSWASYAALSPIDIPESGKKWQGINQRYFSPPIVQAFFSYFQNKDMWLNQSVWSPYQRIHAESERKESTSELAKDVGPLIGASPERMETAFGKVFTESNPFLSIAGLAYKAIATAISDTDAEENFITKDLVESLPKGLIKKTPTYDPKIYRTLNEAGMDTRTRKFETDLAFDKLLDGIEEGTSTSNDAIRFIGMQDDPYEAKRLLAHFKHFMRTGNSMHAKLLRSIAAVPAEERAKTAYDIYKHLPDSQKDEFMWEMRIYPGLVTRKYFWYEFNEFESQHTGRGLFRDSPR